MKLCLSPIQELRGFFAVAEWIEDSALAGAPLASYAATQQETYRDPQTGPTVPNAMGQKRKYLALHIFRFLKILMFCFGLFIWVPFKFWSTQTKPAGLIYFSMCSC